jgi:hypothetical protein
LPSETAIQKLFLPYPPVVQFFNLYYDSLHFPVLIACLVWLFVRYRDRYKQWRTTLVVFTALCLLVQLVPVAPPRMLPATGMKDTAILYHQSVYGTVAGFNADQLSAMPSVHVGWAILVAIAVITTARSRWRWLALGYPIMTTLAVVVTANHFWLDGIVAGGILALVLTVQSLVRRLVAARGAANATAESRKMRPGRSWRPVVDDDAKGLGEHRRDQRQLTRTDDRTTQGLEVDDQAELGPAQVGLVHGDLAEIGPHQLRFGEGAPDQRRTGEVDVAEHAILENHVGQRGGPEVDRIQLAAAEGNPPEGGTEDFDAR